MPGVGPVRCGVPGASRPGPRPGCPLDSWMGSRAALVGSHRACPTRFGRLQPAGWPAPRGGGRQVVTGSSVGREGSDPPRVRLPARLPGDMRGQGASWWLERTLYLVSPQATRAVRDRGEYQIDPFREPPNARQPSHLAPAAGHPSCLGSEASRVSHTTNFPAASAPEQMLRRAAQAQENWMPRDYGRDLR